MLKKVELAVEENKMQEKVEQLQKDEEQYEIINKQLVKIIRRELKKIKKPNDNRGVAYFCEESYEVECKHTFICALI